MNKLVIFARFWTLFVVLPIGVLASLSSVGYVAYLYIEALINSPWEVLWKSGVILFMIVTFGSALLTFRLGEENRVC